ncbi:MAG: glycosyltransferase family 4 protein [Minisyncoccia bacterium]
METNRNMMYEDRSTKRRILIFSTAYYPFMAGAEIAIKEITNRLSEDFEFDLITAKLDKNLKSFEKIGVVNVYRLGSGKPIFDKFFLPFLGAIRAYKLSRQNNYFCLWAVMITFASGAGFLLNILRFLTGKNRIPMVLSLQEGDSESHLKYRWAGLISLSWRLALSQTDILTGLSNFLLNRAKKYGYKGEAVLVPNGVDLSIFLNEVSLDDKNSLKVKLGKKDEEVFLVTTSRLNHKNAVDDIIRSLVSLPENITLIVIGKGEEGQRLQKLADDLKVAHRVKFLGFLDYEELPKHLSVCDIFIRPSRSEGFGNSFIEAMAVGLPVIGTPVGGIPDFLDDKETGVFCSPDNPQSIAMAVNLILSDRELREKIIYNAKDRVVAMYGWDHISQKMKGLAFDRLLKYV